MSKEFVEEKLSGGNVSNVYRNGNTVLRDSKPESARIHLLLKHLENKGFSHAPRFIGVDKQGREQLSYIEGEAGNYPLKPYMWSESVLAGIAKMLKSYHDAVSDFPVTEGWSAYDLTPNNTEVICHNDFAIYNIIFNKEQPVGIIDFDLAAPGPRIWDIAYTLYTCVPLSRHYHTETGEEIRYNPESGAAEKKERVKLFFKAYGLNGLEKGYLDMIILRLEALCHFMKRKASEGDVAFQKMVDEGHYEHYQKDIAFIQEFGGDWV
ncbi:aminoglycoside phosphotransferase family protein [Mangrovibacillus cuniculi]|uniref:Aminoglycoside phosphotransferase family protein n=1 Tax=Mangrovibacillus cuniculi TaxID=2593652 RepID=A0A7S8CDB6_9BACI|nr:aminoglycoside phosphotransferase family protein [Mangrovibacillus cuniculi]QPC47883.1 aminoglycoside phosphotransferase family protein [Mangrovibacillus cuniculi]